MGSIAIAPALSNSRRMKILLVSFYNDEAYGLRSLHSTLVQNNVDARMLFFKVESKQLREDHAENIRKGFTGSIKNASDKEVELLADVIESNRFDVVGFSLVSSHFSLYKRVYQRIRGIEGIKIVLGGWQPSLNPEDCIEYTDYLCVGEGEIAFNELITFLSTNQPVDTIPNFWINQVGAVIKNPPRPLASDLSSFPIPLFDHKYSYYIENDTLVNYEPYFDNSRYGTFIGRGCPKQCTYCSNSYMANHIYPKSWSKIRYRSNEHVKKELITVKEKLPNVRSINFYDEVFTSDLERIKDLFSWYQKEIQIPFYCFFFPGLCDDEKCRTLASAGLSGVWLGIQSGSPRVRREVFRRIYTNDQVISQARIFHKYGVSVRYDLIFDNPFESFEESLESIFLMLELPRPFSLNLFSLKFFPNTEITKRALDAHIINKSCLDDNHVNDQDTYLIRGDVKNSDNKFINHLAFYISCTSRDSNFYDEKDMIMSLVDNYTITRDTGPVEELIRPFLEASQCTRMAATARR
jgi:anaerobic magnesium-protoporphyrin IX monomethyl ester cyclase